jgi:hypothetical protein
MKAFSKKVPRKMSGTEILTMTMKKIIYEEQHG